MRDESYIVAELLQRWEQQGAALRPNAVEIATALNKDNRDEYPAARAASAELTRTLETFVATTEMLEGHVTARDGMGPLEKRSASWPSGPGRWCSSPSSIGCATPSSPRRHKRVRGVGSSASSRASARRSGTCASG